MGNFVSLYSEFRDEAVVVVEETGLHYTGWLPTTNAQTVSRSSNMDHDPKMELTS